MARRTTEAVTGGLAALAEPSRLEVVEILDRSGPRHVQALADAIGATQQNAALNLPCPTRTASWGR